MLLFQLNQKYHSFELMYCFCCCFSIYSTIKELKPIKNFHPTQRWMNKEWSGYANRKCYDVNNILAFIYTAGLILLLQREHTLSLSLQKQISHYYSLDSRLYIGIQNVILDAVTFPPIKTLRIGCWRVYRDIEYESLKLFNVHLYRLYIEQHYVHYNDCFSHWENTQWRFIGFVC